MKFIVSYIFIVLLSLNGYLYSEELQITATPIMNSNAAMKSPLPGYKGLKWGSSLSTFRKLKYYMKKENPKPGVFCKNGIDTAINMLLSDFKYEQPPDETTDSLSEMGIASVNKTNKCFPRRFISIYNKTADVSYVFYKEQLAMVSGTLKEENFSSLIEEFKTKYTLIENKSHSITYQSVVGYAQISNTDDIEYWTYQSSDDVYVVLIKDISSIVMSSSTTGTNQYGPNNNYGFIYIPKSRFGEIQKSIIDSSNAEQQTLNEKHDKELKADKRKLE